ncbi:MAG: uracil-DNA glycosylase [Spirochaetaceae bacterium]|jgi:DNA polymerase|nr:uracil-DNA glycosylase [Spirochaetaceae bacterium]
MTGSQKNTLAYFFDLADASLSTGYHNLYTKYAFQDDAAKNDAKKTADPVIPGSTIDQENRKSDDSGTAPVFDADDSLEKIAGEIRMCSACKLSAQRKNAVPGEGISRPLVLVVGEGPGADEDALGRPFVGRAGGLLDKMLESIGLSREKNCFIANIVKCRPPNNRDPENDESTVCIHFLERQIDVLKPLVILSLGKISAGLLLNTNESISRLRGSWKLYRRIPLLPTFHPSYLLRDEHQKAFAWEDMKSLCRRLAELSPLYAAETAELRVSRKI